MVILGINITAIYNAIAGKIAKVVSPTTGNFSTLTSDGQLADSGKKPADFSPVAGSASITTLGTITTGTWAAGTIAVNRGGTGATTPAGAATSLNVLPLTGGTMSGGIHISSNANISITGGVFASVNNTFSDSGLSLGSGSINVNNGNIGIGGGHTLTLSTGGGAGFNLTQQAAFDGDPLGMGHHAYVLSYTSSFNGSGSPWFFDIITNGVNFDNGQFFSDGQGNVTATSFTGSFNLPTINSDSGAIFSDGSGTLQAAQFVSQNGNFDIQSDGGFYGIYAIFTGAMTFDNGAFFSDGAGVVTFNRLYSDGGSFVSDGNGNITCNVITADNGAIYSDGSGGLTCSGNITAVGSIISDNGAIYSSGGGILTAVQYYGDGSTLSGIMTAGGSLNFDSGAITSNGAGVITATQVLADFNGTVNGGSDLVGYAPSLTVGQANFVGWGGVEGAPNFIVAGDSMYFDSGQITSLGDGTLTCYWLQLSTGIGLPGSPNNGVMASDNTNVYIYLNGAWYTFNLTPV